MANSKHSMPFLRFFDAIYANVKGPLQERMEETWQQGQETPNGSRQIALDMALVSTALHVKKGELTYRQYAFLGDLYDQALGRYDRGGTIAEMRDRVLALAEDEANREPTAYSLNLLRGYDAMRGTNTAKNYKDLFMKIGSATLTQVEKPPSTKDMQVLEELDVFWTEVVTAARTPQKCYDKDHVTFVADLNKAVIEFVGPAREVINAYDQLSQMEGLKDTEGFIRRSFTNYCAQAVLVDSIVDERELEVFHDLAPTLMFFGSQGSKQNLQEIFGNASKNIDPSDTPLLVSILDVYDQSMKTELANRARSLYFRLANTVFKSDNSVNQDEMAWLDQFKKALYPDGGAENLESTGTQIIIDPESADKIVGEVVTVEQSLEELNSLIGLERAKQELTQLVNFVKVQQMRAEKGLPVTEIPKHLAFCGNHGTGKSVVAKIVANIYRAVGIIKKGHLIEVDRAGLVAGNSSPAAKTKEVVSSAVGGVLFIAEADSLDQDGDADGQEAIDSLVKELEDQKENLVTIIAGNPERIEKFLSANSGLKSKFNKVVPFDDYTPDQMVELFKVFCSRAAFQTNASSGALVKSLFEQLYSERGESFGNAREVRQIFEKIIGNQANRIISLPQVNEEILSTITDEDVRPVASMAQKMRN